MATKNSSKARVLVVDDDSGSRSALTELLREEGYEAHAAADGFKALGRIENWTPDIVLTDLKMPGMDGIQLMEKLRARLPDLAVVVMTAFGSIESAVDAVHQGADDYLSKPLHLGNLLHMLGRVLEFRDLKREADRMRLALSDRSCQENMGIIGSTKSIRELLELAQQIARTDAAILISGENGTGKKLLAQAIHGWSERSQMPFVTICCNASSPQSVENELFGFNAGENSASNATENQSSPSPGGKLKLAQGGTLYFDDIASLSPSTQVRLLKFLQEGCFETNGSSQSVQVDVRPIAATSRDLSVEVKAGRFREDLYYRIKVINLQVPTLRERRDDIPLLAAHFLQRLAIGSGKSIRGISHRALGTLVNYEWPGNIRQLENCIEHAVAVTKTRDIEPRDLPRELLSDHRSSAQMPKVPGATLAELEKFAILSTLEYVGGSTSRAAEILGISPRKIQYRLNDYHAKG